ncbi:MAG TPA: hypothetical protein VEF89_07700, partial [Solirubrobacteraceae bacterium]|nr:hypothetical protein [Solirubrobacteraceae bacterium]
VVGDLGGDRGDVFGADVLGAAFSAVAVAELVVWSVALGRVGLAATAGAAAGVVLLRECSWPQVAEREQSGFDALDCVGQLSFGRHGRSP